MMELCSENTKTSHPIYLGLKPKISNLIKVLGYPETL